MTAQVLSTKEWREQAEMRFGPKVDLWRFTCPACSYETTVSEWRRAGAPEGAIAFSCVGRWTGAARDAFVGAACHGPCNYAGGGLFSLNPVLVRDDDGVERRLFAFAR